MKKVKNGIEKLVMMVDLLKKAGNASISTSQLMKALDCNRNSVNNYYNRCIKAGIKINKTKVGHETGYYLEDDDIVYEPMTVDAVRKFIIMQNIKPGKEQKQELLGRNISRMEAGEQICSLLGSIGTTKYYGIINELIEEGELIKVDGRYYPGRKKIPVKWFINEEAVIKYLNILTLIPPGYHSHSVVEKVFEKINAVYMSEERHDEMYVVMGKEYTVTNRIHALLSKMNNIDYIHSLVRITYAEEGRDFAFAVGLVVYSVEKDKLYLVGERAGSGFAGETTSDKKKNMEFLDVDRIKAVNLEKGINRCYQSDKYVDVYNKMFSVGNSAFSEEEIQIVFENDVYILERLENLCEYRKESRAYLERKDGKLIYHDRIIGIEDFFRFLRQFTGKYEISNSPQLNHKKYDSLNKMLDRYGERI